MRPGYLHARLAAGGGLATGAGPTPGLLTSLVGPGPVALTPVAVRTMQPTDPPRPHRQAQGPVQGPGS